MNDNEFYQYSLWLRCKDVVLQRLEIKNSNAVFTFTMDDNTQDTFISGDTGMLALIIDDEKTRVELAKRTFKRK